MESEARSTLAAERHASTAPRRTADVLVDILADVGVEVVFGLPGGTISPLYDALLDRKEIRVVTTRHEGSAMFAAAGYARTTGKPGVVLVTSGPGVINAMTGLASAYCDGLPVVLLAGEVPRRLHGKGALQEGSAHHLNIVGMTSHITKQSIEITDPHAAAPMLRRAIATAMSGRRGPVLVTLPLDVTTAMCEPSAVALDVSTSFSIPEWALADAARHLGRGPRTVIFAGSGLRSGGGPAALREFAEWTQFPVMTTPKGKGVFPEDHPLSVGVFGLGGHPSSTKLLEQGVDVMLAVGTSLGDLATNGWSKLITPRRALIHVDVEANQIGRNYLAQLGIVAPGELFFRSMMERLPQAKKKQTYGVKTFSDPSLVSIGTTGQIAPHRALWELQQVLPKDTIYTCDSGEHFMFAVHYLKVTAPDGFVVMSGLGSMTSGICGALGARLGRPDRPIAAICGDGGFAMAAAEVSTAVAEQLPIVFVVMNDERLGMVERGHSAVYGRTPSFSTSPLHIPEMARAMGARTMTIERPGQLLDMGFMLRRLTCPLVVEVRVDPTVRLPKNSRDEVMGGNAGKRRVPN